MVTKTALSNLGLMFRIEALLQNRGPLFIEYPLSPWLAYGPTAKSMGQPCGVVRHASFECPTDAPASEFSQAGGGFGKDANNGPTPVGQRDFKSGLDPRHGHVTQRRLHVPFRVQHT